MNQMYGICLNFTNMSTLVFTAEEHDLIEMSKKLDLQETIIHEKLWY